MSMPSTVRHINETQLAQTLFRHGAMSRAELARQLGLTRSTAGNLVARLVQEGMILEADKSATGRSEEAKPIRTGRPGDEVHLNPDFGIFLGADIGVSHLTVVALDLNANLLAHTTRPLTKDQASPKSIVKLLAKLIGKTAGALSDSQTVRGLGVTIPGLLSHDGRVLRAPLLGWHDVPLMAMLKAELTEIDSIKAHNDANASAFAELYQDRVQEPGDAVYLFLDAGVGGALFANGALVTGRDGYAGELGHMLVGESGYGPLLTLKGSLESYVGASALLSRYKHHRVSRRASEPTLDTLIAAATVREPAALATLEDCSFYLARGMASLISIFNPDKIVLGGPASALFALSAEGLSKSIQENLLPEHPLPRLSFSSLGSDAPAIGAACLMHRSFLAIDDSLVFHAAKSTPETAGKQRR